MNLDKKMYKEPTVITNISYSKDLITASAGFEVKEDDYHLFEDTDIPED